jgi:NAD(P) transhydrogenase subunit alpha
LASRIAEDASALYARNVLNFLKLLVDPKDKKLLINQDDEIIKATLMTFNKKVLFKSSAS